MLINIHENVYRFAFKGEILEREKERERERYRERQRERKREREREREIQNIDKTHLTKSMTEECDRKSGTLPMVKS